MTLDSRLVAKGNSEPRAGLAQQGKAHVGLAKQYAAELEGAGWSAADTDALASNVEKLEQAVGAQAKAYDHAGATSMAESRAVDDAKAFLRRLRNALPRAIRETPGAGVTLESFHVGATLGRSTPKISKYLTEIMPGVKALDAALTKHFKGQSAAAELAAVKEALDKADTAQELARKNAPGETLSPYERMGRVLEQIEDLNRSGKSAFDGDATIRGKFNKDILLRARKERVKKGEAAPAGDAPQAT